MLVIRPCDLPVAVLYEMATWTSGCASGCAQSIGTETLPQLVVGACG